MNTIAVNIQQEKQLPEKVSEKLSNDFPNGIKKLLFIAPPDGDSTIFSYDSAIKGRYLNFPPYGLALLAKISKKYNIDSEIIVLQTEVLKKTFECKSDSEFNFNMYWKEKLEEIQFSDYDAICVTCMFSQSSNITKQVVDFINELNESKAPILMGGVHITNMFLEADTRSLLLNDFKFCDYFFLYEADAAFEEFLEAVNKKHNNLSQLYIRNTHLFENRKVPSVENLNSIPSWDLIDPRIHSKYGKVGAFYYLKHTNPVTATILANRGCRAQCTFCSVRNFNGVGVRRRSVDSVINELLLLQNEYGVEHIMWLDDDFFYNTEETLFLFNEIIKRNIKITWDCSNGVIASSCNKELLTAARDAGCIGLIIGMESGSRRILKEIKKPGTVETFLKAAENLQFVPEIHSRVFLMIGFPNETFGDILETFNVALQMNLDWYNIAPLQPLPNTPIFKSMVDQGLINPTLNSITDIRFNSGAYSKSSERSKLGKDLLSLDFKQVFNNDHNSIPTKVDLDLIWGYMNYHLNYDRLNRENRELKSELALKYLNQISNSIAPDNAIALYYKILLSPNYPGKNNEIIRMQSLLENNEYWRNRFSDFSLKIEKLTH